MAIHHTRACVTGAREGYRTARTELGAALPPHALDAVLAAYRAEGRRLVATAQAVELVARALRGEVFTPQLQDAPPAAQDRPPAAQDGPPAEQPGTSSGKAGPKTQDELSAKRKAADAAESPAERPARDGAAKARKPPAAQRPPARNGGARRKARASDKQAAAG
jgi:hypothetical protein